MTTTQPTLTEIAQAFAKAPKFGRKAFIHKVYEATGKTVSLAQFKSLLWKLNRTGQVSLSRCDLVDAHSPADVAASRFDPWNDGVDELHFVEIGR